MTENQAPPMLRPALMAGAVTGLMTSVPLIGGVLMLACCSPVIGCGFLAAYWYEKACREAGVPFTPVLGKTIGLISGAFWAATVTLFVVWTWPGIDVVSDGVEQAWDAMGQTTPELLDMLDRFREFYADSSGFMLVLMAFFVYLLMAAVFSTIGGMIGGAVFRDKGTSA